MESVMGIYVHVYDFLHACMLLCAGESTRSISNLEVIVCLSLFPLLLKRHLAADLNIFLPSLSLTISLFLCPSLSLSLFHTVSLYLSVPLSLCPSLFLPLPFSLSLFLSNFFIPPLLFSFYPFFCRNEGK